MNAIDKGRMHAKYYLWDRVMLVHWLEWIVNLSKCTFLIKEEVASDVVVTSFEICDMALTVANRVLGVYGV